MKYLLLWALGLQCKRPSKWSLQRQLWHQPQCCLVPDNLGVDLNRSLIVHVCWIHFQLADTQEEWGREVDEALAGEIREFRSPTDGTTRMFYEMVIAPGYTHEGLARLKGKSKTLRILQAPARAPSGRSLRQVAGAAQVV